MYRITCDGLPIYDVRDEELAVINPKVKLEENTVGEGSFTIYKSHPYYSRLKMLRSVFEISDENGVIFRGRMTENSLDFENGKAVDLEGAMAYFNDSYVKPFSFPGDFLNNDAYIAAANGGNVYAFFLGWLIGQHNAQVQNFQRFKLGRVTVTDPNNYVTRSNSSYATTWETLKSKLFSSAAGGYLCIRYEDDGNYIDYLADFELTNIQNVVFGENLLNLKNGIDGNSTYSVIVPLGADLNESDEDAENRLTLSGVADGDIDDDIVKEGITLYSRRAVEEYGRICAPPADTTWDDVTKSNNLLRKGVEFLKNTGVMLTNSIEVSAVDLHFTDAEISSFRIYRFIRVISVPHGIDATYKLTKLEIDLQNPQNTKITIGETKKTLTSSTASDMENIANRIEKTENRFEEEVKDAVESLEGRFVEQRTEILSDSQKILMQALEQYVLTSNYAEYQETIAAQLALLSSELSLQFTRAMAEIESVDGDLQSKYNTITKYFTFDINGLTIGQSDSPFKVVIDNDRYSMYAYGVEVLWIANGEVYAPEITVTHKFTLFDLVFTQDEDGTINGDFVGGDA